MINFARKLNWRNKSDGKPETILYKEDLLRYENGIGDLADIVDTGRLSDNALRENFGTRHAAVLQAGRALPNPVVAGNSFGIAFSSAQTKNGTSRSPHTFAVDASGIRLVFQNFYVATAYPMPDTDGTATLTVKASVEFGSNIYRVTFRGQHAVTIDPGGIAISDPLGIEVPAGSTIYSRTHLVGTGWYPNKTAGGSVGGGGFVADADLTAQGSGAVADSSTALYAPSAIIGLPSRPVPNVAIIGDSIANGIGDGGSSTDNRGIQADGTQGGFIARAFHAKVPCMILARAGERAQGFVFTSSHHRRLGFVGGFSHALVEYGRNDLSQSRTASQVKADLVALWKLLAGRGMIVRQTTITPQTTSTDAWATTQNQTIANASQETVRVEVNTWIRAGAPTSGGVATTPGAVGAVTAGHAGHPLSGYFDIADLAETARNSGIWRAAFTVDGTHPTAVGHAALSAGIDVALFTV
ncbi:SGNH/GDSL hydrolase family protein [Rhodococcus sp. (in: high G+C Gram-positive bacteria)]|uniref:SGNH/GDSL hydrolase family protein n=1 Tax=Rhodococcus sp. TaxID=1831 RepID=UPI001A2B8EBF|nr:SGNH/GDSL hydrolase family protein [Rhodococcus sp. (in: high G+C Gram-positive bacteria)]MBJ7479268.1 SGNH/GDSL hydrolase family protein [Rhodococcus sp. (in: high G+C Gram-positive bacteria)]